jgi:hypothetical protein
MVAERRREAWPPRLTNWARSARFSDMPKAGPISRANEFHLDDNGLWGKYANFEAATRPPLIVSAPGHRNSSGGSRLRQ